MWYFWYAIEWKLHAVTSHITWCAQTLLYYNLHTESNQSLTCCNIFSRTVVHISGWSECLHSLMVGAERTSCSGWTLHVLSIEDSVCFNTGSDAHNGGPFTGRTSRETLLKWRSDVPRPLKGNRILAVINENWSARLHPKPYKAAFHTSVYRHPWLTLIAVIYRLHKSIPSSKAPT